MEEVKPKSLGFWDTVTNMEAAGILLLPPKEKAAEILWRKFHHDVLRGRAVDTIEKVKMKGIIRFCVNDLIKVEE